MHMPTLFTGTKVRGPVCIDITHYLKCGQLASISCFESQTSAIPDQLKAHKNVNLPYRGGVCVENDL